MDEKTLSILENTGSSDVQELVSEIRKLRVALGESRRLADRLDALAESYRLALARVDTVVEDALATRLRPMGDVTAERK